MPVVRRLKTTVLNKGDDVCTYKIIFFIIFLLKTVALDCTGMSTLNLNANSTEQYETARITYSYNEPYINVAHFCTHSRLRRNSGA